MLEVTSSQLERGRLPLEFQEAPLMVMETLGLRHPRWPTTQVVEINKVAMSCKMKCDIFTITFETFQQLSVLFLENEALEAQKGRKQVRLGSEQGRALYL